MGSPVALALHPCNSTNVLTDTSKMLLWKAEKDFIFWL